MGEYDVRAILIELAKIQSKLEEVEELAKKTNGRVSKLEEFKFRLDGARSATRLVEPAIAGLVVAICVYLMQNA
jgi:hypothetical protein